MYSFSYLEPVCCSMCSSNCCFLTGIQVSQEAGQVVWYSHLFQNFPQFIVSHTVKGFGIVNKAEIDVFLELSCWLHNKFFSFFFFWQYLRWILYCTEQVLVHIFKRVLSYQGNCQYPSKCWLPLLLWLWLCFPWRYHGVLPFRKSSLGTQFGEPNSWQEGRGLTAGSPDALSQQPAPSLVQTDVSLLDL